MFRIPIVSTLVVLVAVAVMVGLGVWQLERRTEKEALLARYARAGEAAGELDWPVTGPGAAQFYRRARLECRRVSDYSAMAGRNQAGEAGFARTAQCHTAQGGVATVVMGWTQHADVAGDWSGGTVHGVIAPGPRLVADPPLGGLAANARPDPSELPNNHLSYAVQWFLFAITALVIYAMVLRRRLRA